jgi:drug/metabolite transporter, DME family
VADRSVLSGSLIIVLAASGFGILGPLARFAYDAGFDPISFVGWRAIFGVLVILLVVLWRRSRGVAIVNPFDLPRADSLGLLIVGLAGVTLNIAMFIAFGIGSVALVLLAFYTYPAMVAVVASVLGHERLDGTRVLALLLALAGMVLVVAGGLEPTGGVTIQPVAIALGLFAAFFQTIFVTMSRSRFAIVPAEQAMGWLILISAVASVALAIATGGNLGAPFGGWRPFGIAALAGIVGAGIPSTLFLVGIRTIGGTRAGILMLFEPMVGVTLAAVLLHETLVPVQVAGGAAILAAALLLQRTARPGERIEPLGVPTIEHP